MNNPFRIALAIACVAVSVALLISCWLLLPVALHNPVNHFLLNHNHQHLSVNDIATIQDWMTFSYINTAFDIPSGYLKETLSISDASYPNMTIMRYAGEQKLSSVQALGKVKQAVIQRLLPPQ